MRSQIILKNQRKVAQYVRRFIVQLLTLLLVSSTLSIITPQVANAATVGSAPCVQTVDNASTVAVTSSGGYCYIAFKSGTNVWTPPAGVSAIDLLVVAGGGGGASRHAGGGGAGGLLQSTNLSINSTNLSIRVGLGGAGGPGGLSNGTSGQDSTVSGGGIDTRTAIGGGGGAHGAISGSSGGSGGGSGSDGGSGGNGTEGQGNAGSRGITSYPGSTAYWVGGGGGGAGGNGVLYQLTPALKAGSGGAGLEISWIPTSVGETLGVGTSGSAGRVFAGGGGGGSDRDSIGGGTGGTGGGGNGSTGTATSSFERFTVRVKPARGKAFVITTDKASALIDLPQGMRYTVTVTAVGYGSLNSKVLKKVISVPKRR